MSGGKGCPTVGPAQLKGAQLHHQYCQSSTRGTSHTPCSQLDMHLIAGGDGDAGGDADGQPHPGGAPLGGHRHPAGPPLPRRPVRPAAGALLIGQAESPAGPGTPLYAAMTGALRRHRMHRMGDKCPCILHLSRVLSESVLTVGSCAVRVHPCDASCR